MMLDEERQATLDAMQAFIDAARLDGGRGWARPCPNGFEHVFDRVGGREDHPNGWWMLGDVLPYLFTGAQPADAGLCVMVPPAVWDFLAEHAKTLTDVYAAINPAPRALTAEDIADSVLDAGLQRCVSEGARSAELLKYLNGGRGRARRADDLEMEAHPNALMVKLGREVWSGFASVAGALNARLKVSDGDRERGWYSELVALVFLTDAAFAARVVKATADEAVSAAKAEGKRRNRPRAATVDTASA